MFHLSNEEQLRRANLVRSARALAMKCLLIKPVDADSISTHFCGFHIQVSFSEQHPLFTVCLEKKIKVTKTRKLLEAVNDLNLHSVMGSHAINLEAGCYSYRAVCWLETELTRDRMDEILDRLASEALKGYIRVSA